MNILFLLRSLDIGGLEVVTATLANKFVTEGHHVYVFAFEKRSGRVMKRFDKRIGVEIGHGYCCSNYNVSILRQLIISNNIKIVINQWALPLIPIRTLRKAKYDLDVKIISVYHNDPSQNGRIQGVELQIQKTPKLLNRLFFKFEKYVYRCITGYTMRYNYNHSDVFVVLSHAFIANFRRFTWLDITNKLIIQTNPITINTDNFVYNMELKRKEIIYVGRIDSTQKRVSRIVETWTQLERHFPDWQLTIVGDGDERGNIEKLVSDFKLEHVNFEGFQSPRPYYERASILMLTSEFEGFPLVLAECMSFGVVPMVYGSYPAVYDIIDNNLDGIIVPKTNDGFCAVEMAEKCKSLMVDNVRLNKMALAAMKKSRNYSLVKIYGQWMEMLKNL